MKKRAGLILTGGGARAAYQVGVLKAIAEFLPRRAHNPFPVICGTSAGALNAAALAINARSFRKGVSYLDTVWKNFRASQVYRTDVVGVFNNTVLWLTGLILSGLGINKLKRIALLDNSPLIDFLEQVLPCEKIQDSIDAGLVHALSVTASGYSSGQSVTFYQGAEQLASWRRTRRIGIPARIEIRHLLASSALPFIFPAALVNREYFGDGSMRQIAPISSALHLGATHILVIGVTSNGYVNQSQRADMNEYPSLAHIAGHALNSIFLDSMEVDLERVQRINELAAMLPEQACIQADIKHVDVLVISPSQPIEKIAERYASELPWTIRLLLRMVGAMPRGGGILLSYLLSEGKFCSELIDLGYRDAQKRRDEILRFLDTESRPDDGMPR
ncbi:MAG: Patatin [Gallionellales bacterium RIFCSPLOWO2_12_FULL_59_22]|nr:MAG: Patatin [Gallionellales bacterium RIFCSPLOWO2_02_FULL_59_110]OGT05096.1 MAG: Patatin [Gallionellales bacterium RIFCSPLOWO2_02_58_13]OGT13721.1 MAG: Patatin [Gallionellales bacterium RIFCSPLOWO2_12_FULL_59_22]